MKTNETVNKPFALAEAFVNYTSRNIFLTGKAGTGKTTFLKHIIKTTSKKTAVTAPTGVAAIHAGGVTLHSLFQLPFGAYIPDPVYGTGQQFTTRDTLIPKLRLNANKRKLIREMELLIIDEISMVRADMLDAADAILRFVRKEDRPFGGLQVLMIGDLFQLPPVVADGEWNLLKNSYETPFFFSARALKQEFPISINLEKIYRQTDREFVDVLNSIRMNNMDPKELEWLNQRYKPDYEPAGNEQVITLTTHNRTADTINRNRLKKLTGKTYRFTATVTGEFNESAYPVAQHLELKEGCQVIFTKNDREEPRRYFNGKIGVVSEISKDSIKVAFPEENQEIDVEEEEWKNVRYAFNEESDELEENTIGNFKQYPLKLAWAITIHKSQGLTFPQAVVDAGASFSAGQVYVALSRLTSVEGLTLKSRITPQSVKTDPAIVNFTASAQDPDSLQPVLQREKQHYVAKTLLKTFNWEFLTEALQEHHDYVLGSKVTFKDTANDLIYGWKKLLTEQKKIASNFTAQVLHLFQAEDWKKLHERINAAVNYFNKQLAEEITSKIRTHIDEVKNKKNTKTYIKHLKILYANINRKTSQLDQALLLAAGLKSGADSTDLLDAAAQHQAEQREQLQKEAESIQVSAHTPKGSSKLTSLKMYKEGKSMGEIAVERDMAISTIEGHLTDFVKTGELSVEDLVEPEKTKEVIKAIAEKGFKSLNELKQLMGNDYTYGELRAVVNHLQKDGEKL